MKALGFIETKGRIGAIVAADTALKSANVNLICLKKVSGGLVTLIVEGDVAAVYTAVEAGKEAASKLCSRKVSTNVIPRPTDDLIKLIEQIKKEKGSGIGIRRKRKGTIAKEQKAKTV